MSDGLVTVYSLLDHLPLDGETYLCSHTLNKTTFGLKDSDPRQRPFAVKTMAVVSGGSQVSQNRARLDPLSSLAAQEVSTKTRAPRGFGPISVSHS